MSSNLGQSTALPVHLSIYLLIDSDGETFFKLQIHPFLSWYMLKYFGNPFEYFLATTVGIFEYFINFFLQHLKVGASPCAYIL